MITDKQVEAACIAYWEIYREMWRPSGILTSVLDVSFLELPDKTRELTSTAMRAALEAAEAAAWEPIDTSPEDCRHVMVFGGRHADVSVAPADGNWWRESGLNACPTHWRPLPEPPKEYKL